MLERYTCENGCGKDAVLFVGGQLWCLACVDRAVSHGPVPGRLECEICSAERSVVQVDGTLWCGSCLEESQKRDLDRIMALESLVESLGGEVPL